MDTHIYSGASASSAADGDIRLQVTADYYVLRYLAQGDDQRGPHRFSKAEAYLDLVSRQRLAKLMNDNSYTNVGILTLAHAWSWDRATVKKFIDTLCEYGAASVERVGRCQIVKLTNVVFIAQ